MIAFEVREPGHTTGAEIYVGHVPGRKRPVLGLSRGTTFEVLAYFRDDEAAGRAAVWLRRMALYNGREAEA